MRRNIPTRPLLAPQPKELLEKTLRRRRNSNKKNAYFEYAYNIIGMMFFVVFLHSGFRISLPTLSLFINGTERHHRCDKSDIEKNRRNSLMFAECV